MQQAFKFQQKEPPFSPLPKVDYDYQTDSAHWNGIILVGEAPGAEEVRLNHPFVGRSGQLLDKMLEKAEIKRQECLIANVFRYQPPGNKVDHFFLSRRAAKEQARPLAEDLGPFGSAYCLAEFAPEIEYLRATIDNYAKKRDPKEMILVALGRTPLWALTGENGLLEKIGKPLPCRLARGLTVIPTFHPSFILRGNWARQDEWLGHFVAARQYVS
jgi:DNA polymerase